MKNHLKVCFDPAQSTPPTDEELWCPHCKEDSLRDTLMYGGPNWSKIHFTQCINCPHYDFYERGGLDNSDFLDRHHFEIYCKFLRRRIFNGKINQ
ncbi:MAG: hypothetical protein GWN01_11945 [Nitrosopumilaceae archaeon]|nr:hypothetical protein [Nitrosopumilaceae archaeon]NIU01588.1 hypothetical protein [Nitrosopumilaceae archaeon]NIU88007.1 hypothetical protein [Nitrosopumilaceae archaeon]NIV66274.1 hypothetical protein [Nitrosopumilaceae archaeon]NIX62190.1 hypothetical protein [Nitrosopumilaceae archaeon]